MTRLNDDVLADLVQRLSRGEPVLDVVFDRVYPPPIRDASCSFWTPVRIALHAAELLTCSGARRVLDVGSGAGKFCMIGAAATNAFFVGVEQRASLVDVARDTAVKLGIRSVLFVHGNFDLFDVTRFDALYFFNPFEENLWPSESRFDDSADLEPRHFWRDIDTAVAMLDRARQDTRVVTYHGIGCEMPYGWELATKDRYLELWIKSKRSVA